MTLNELINTYIEHIESMPLLYKSWEYGAGFEINRKTDVVYPAVYIERPNIAQIDISSNTRQITCGLKFTDRSFEDLSNRLNILSNLENMALIFIKSYTETYQAVEVRSASIIYDEEAYQDRCYLIRLEFTAVVEYDNVCDDIMNFTTNC